MFNKNGNSANGKEELELELGLEEELPVTIGSVIIGKDEMNLAEFPFTLLSRRTQIGQNTIEISQQVRDPEGKIINQEWVVTGSDKYGLPLAIDEDVYVALMQLYKEDGFRSRRVHFSRYQLLRMMGKGTSKERYDMIAEALERMVSVSVVSKNAFWDNIKKSYLKEAAFHIIESYGLHDEKLGRKGFDPKNLPLSYVVLSEALFESIKAGYIKNLDAGFYFGLGAPLSKRLYRYLDKKKYRKSRFEIELYKLAALLPIQDEHPSQIKRRLNKAHDELIEKGFLESASYEEIKNSDKEKVIYVFPQVSLAEREGAEEEGREGKEEEEALSLMQELVERRITESVAAKLVEDYPAQQIEKQITVFDWLLERKSPNPGKNPPGFLRKSIENNYVPPLEYIEEISLLERRAAEDAKLAEAEQRRWAAIEDELANWDRIPPEERVKGFVDFWLLGEKINKGRTPKPEEIEAKVREQAANLPQTEEERRDYLTLKHTLEEYLY